MYFLSAIKDGILSLIFPDICEVCGQDLVKGEKCICIQCVYSMPVTRYWQYKDNDVAKIFWGRVEVENACSLFYYRDGSKYRQLIHKLKYKGNYHIGFTLGEQLGKKLKNSELYKDIDFIIPVPLHKKRLKERGYNQSEHIALGISNILKIPVENNLLIRNKYTETQTRRVRKERLENMISAFGVKNADKFVGKHILLVDDIITTGSTIEACVTVIANNTDCRVSVASLGFASL